MYNNNNNNRNNSNYVNNNNNRNNKPVMQVQYRNLMRFFTNNNKSNNKQQQDQNNQQQQRSQQQSSASAEQSISRRDQLSAVLFLSGLFFSYASAKLQQEDGDENDSTSSRGSGGLIPSLFNHLFGTDPQAKTALACYLVAASYAVGRYFPIIPAAMVVLLRGIDPISAAAVGFAMFPRFAAIAFAVFGYYVTHQNDDNMFWPKLNVNNNNRNTGTNKHTSNNDIEHNKQ